MGKAMYGFVRFLKPFVRLILPAKIMGQKKFEDKKTIFVINHNSAWDPIAMTAYFKNHIKFMYKAEFRKNGFLSGVFDAMDFVPVARGDADLGAIKKSLSILNNDGILGIFPEGTRCPDIENLKSFHTGAALLALKTRAPVRFFYIWDKCKAFRKNYIAVGDEITLDEFYGRKINKELLDEVSSVLWNKLNGLKQDTEKYMASIGKKRRKPNKKEKAKLEKYLALRGGKTPENGRETAVEE